MASGSQGAGPQHPDRAAAGDERLAGDAPGGAERYVQHARAGGAVAAGVSPNSADHATTGLCSPAAGRRIPEQPGAFGLWSGADDGAGFGIGDDFINSIF